MNLSAKFFTTKSSNHWNFWAVLGPVGLTWCFVILSLILFVSTKLLPDLFNILLFQYKLNVIIVLSNLKHSVPKKCSIQNLFIRKTFHVLFWANLWGLSYMGGDYWSDHAKREEFHKCIFQWSEHYEFEDLPQPLWHIHLKIKPWPVCRIMEGFIMFIVPLYVDPDLVISFKKLKAQIEGWI